MIAQRDLIANMLLLCRTIYPSGNNGTGNTGLLQYPATPTGANAGRVSAITCPGQGTPAPIWSGDARGMAPRPLPGFSPWTYANNGSSIVISTTIINTGSTYYRDLLDAVVAKIGNQAVHAPGSDTLTITLVN